MIPIEQIRYNIHWIGVAIDGYLAMPKSGGELCDKREHEINDNIMLFSRKATVRIIDALAREIIKVNKL